MNLPEKLQEHLAYPKLQVIDANTGLPEDTTAFNAFSQSALISFLTGLYKSTRTKETALVISDYSDAASLLSGIFKNESELADAISAYTNESAAASKEKLMEVATGWLAFQKQIPADEKAGTDHLQNLMTSQRHEILRYLPGGLKLGDLLNDDTLEDKSNKMEGPISSLMHKIENSFSTSD